MKRMLCVFFLVITSSAYASGSGGGNSTTICTTGAPTNCVTTNWGHIVPDGTSDAMTPTTAPPAGTTLSHRRMAVQLMPVASSRADAAMPVTTVLSPVDLFPRETLALQNAVRRLRFDADGKIVSGESVFAAAATAAANKAGRQYTLTVYIKVPQHIQDKESTSLARKVQSINDVLGKSLDRDAGGGPGS